MRGGQRFGSGRKSSKAWVEEYLSLDIKLLAQHPKFSPGNSFNWAWWNVRGQRLACMTVHYDNLHKLKLIYSWQKDGYGPRVDVVIPIQLDYTLCAFGGNRPWFICPSCQRRCAILYQTSSAWACRTSLKLAYESQSEDAWDRWARRVWKAEYAVKNLKGRHKNTREKLQQHFSDLYWSYHTAVDNEIDRRMAICG